MAGKAAAPGTAVLLVTANVGSLFDDPENLQKNWLREFYQVMHTHKPHFMALHCQEFGGKNYEASMSHVDKFVKELLSSDAMKEYNRARVYLDENYKSQEHFTAPPVIGVGGAVTWNSYSCRPKHCCWALECQMPMACS